MLITWTPPSIVWSETKPAYRQTVLPQTPSAIIWTEGEEAYEYSLLEQRSTNIDAIKNWIERERDLVRIREFGDDWDGLDSDAPDNDVMNRADLFLRILKDREPGNPPMRVTLSPSGSIAMEWLVGNSFIRAEIGDSDEIDWMLAVPGLPTEFKVESLAPWASEAVEGQEWKPVPAPVGELGFASAH